MSAATNAITFGTGQPVCIPVKFQPTYEGTALLPISPITGTTIMPSTGATTFAGLPSAATLAPIIATGATIPAANAATVSGSTTVTKAVQSAAPAKANLNWLWILLGLLVLILVGGFLWYSYNKAKNIFGNLNSTLKSVQTSANSVGATSNAIHSSVNNLNQGVSNASSYLREHQPQIQQTLSNAQNRLSTLATDVRQRTNALGQDLHNASSAIQSGAIPAIVGGTVATAAGATGVAGANQSHSLPIRNQNATDLDQWGDGGGSNGSSNGSSGVNALSGGMRVSGLASGNSSSFGSGTVYSSKTSDTSDPGLFSFFSDSDVPTPTPGQGMPSSFTDGSGSKQWRAVPIGPIQDGQSGSDEFDADCDDALVLPPTVTLDQQRKAIQRESAMRPMSNGNFGKNKNKGKVVGLWGMMNPPPERTGNNRPSGTIPFGVTDSYFSAANGGMEQCNYDTQGMEQAFPRSGNGSISQYYNPQQQGYQQEPGYSRPSKFSKGGEANSLGLSLNPSNGRTAHQLGDDEW